MTKKILALALSLFLVFAFSACTSGTQSSAPPADTGASPSAAGGERIVLKFAAQADSTPGTQAVLDAFNASQDKYTVEWMDMTNDSGAMRDQLITSLQAGSSDYDLLSLDVVWAGEFAAAGYIDPIDSYMKDAGLSASQFNAGSMASGKYSGKQYVLPFFPDLGVLYFRKDIVSEEDAARLESGDYTWADLQAMALAYKGAEGTTDGFVYQSSQYEGLVCNANEFTLNWTDIRGGLEAMKAMADSGAAPADILNYTEGETANSFINGQSVFARNWPYQWGSIKSEGSIGNDQVSIAPLPGGGTVGGWLLAINANSVNKEGAWELMKFIATDQGQKLLSVQGGYLPGFNATLEDPEVIAGNEMLSMPGFQLALTTTIARPVSAEYSKVSDALQQAIYPYLSGSSDLDTAVAAVEAALSE